MDKRAPEEAGELMLLGIQATTLFELTESGRLRHENSPDRSPAPRLWMGGSAAGNIIRLRFDVREETAHAIDALVAREPAMSEAQSVPVHIDKYAELLGAEAPVEEISRGITYVFPDSFEHEQGARVVSSDTDEGTQLLARLDAGGMPDDLVKMGFVDTTHFWPPWCVALEDGTIVSVAFTARLSALGAEVGVATPSRFRGRGFAAATTAAWSSLPSLVGRVLFYTTSLTNVSSLRVADRLRLNLVGPSLSIR